MSLPVLSYRNLTLAVLEALVPQGDAEGDSHEIGVGELDPCGFLAIIQEGFDAGCPKLSW